MNVAGVTPRQRDLLEAFQSFVNVNGYSPSYIELKEALGFASTSSVARLVDALEETWIPLQASRQGSFHSIGGAAMRYGSVCSGIEAASVAWAPLNWSPTFFAEIENFPSAVLAHHYGSNMPGDDHSKNGVPNYGDMTKFQEWPDHAIDLLVGGTPCQSFSVAGLRKGLDDPRGNLMLTYLAIARRYQPKWLVWENVPGVLSSNGGRDFGTFIRGLEECGYHAAWRVLDAQYVRVDGFGRAVPQRRRRVFVVGYLGDWRRAAAVLFERESLSGDHSPRRQPGEGSANPVARSLAIRGRDGTPTAELGEDIANAILTPNGGRAGIGVGAILLGGFDHENNAHGPDDATGPLLKGSPSGGGRPLPAIVVSEREVAGTVSSKWAKGTGGPAGDEVQNLVAFAQNTRDEVRLFGGDGQIVGALAAEPGMKQQSYVAHAIQAGALRVNPESGPDGVGVQEGVSYTLEARTEVQAVQHQWVVRRLTPTECERLQGFPDGYTLIPIRKALAADGPRYKALGNSMAINCMRWLGQRIAKVEAMSAMELAA